MGQTASSNPSTTSSTIAATPGTRSSTSPGKSCPSLAVIGQSPVTYCEDWYKTVFSKVLRALIDPNAAPVRTAPREERDLFIAAGNGHLLAFDNLSDLPAWVSDALCRLASGGSFAVRQLYTDRDEVLFQAARPIILNGIEDVIARPDLADRAIFLTLPHLSEECRRSKKRFGTISRPHNHTPSGHCWTPQTTACVRCLKFDWNSCPGGRLCNLGDRLRTDILPRWRLSAGLQSKPPVRHRGYGRCGPGSGAYPRHHGRADLVERQCFGPLARRRPKYERRPISDRRRMAKIASSACRPSPAGADAPPSAGHRN